MNLRSLHRWPGLIVAALLIVTALSGAALSVFPALETLRTPQPETTLSLADLATRVQAAHPGIEQIKRAPSGQISAWWFEAGQPGSAIVDPSTGQAIAPAEPNPLQRWLTQLHRALFLGDGGRLATAAGALTLLFLSLSGSVLIARRTSGWRRWFSRLRGPLAARLHTEIARIVLPGLILSSATALWMVAETFDVITIDEPRLEVPAQISPRASLKPADMPALQAIPVATLRELSFPDPRDSTDVFTLKTDHGTGYVDQGTGTVLSWQQHSLLQSLSETIYMLHTGQGAAMLGLLLGIAALGASILAATGVLIWLAARNKRPALHGNAPAAQADTVVLVGSEGGSTWGFAATLANALRLAGHTVHIAAMSSFKPTRYRHAQRLLILTATYGDGDAPASAKGFLEQLDTMDSAPAAPLAVLGFGDRSFPAYCAFATAVEQAARAKGWATLLPLETIDRQSAQGFARWGQALGQAIGTPLTLSHQPASPATTTLTLIERRDYGQAVHAPMAILRFAIPASTPVQRLMGQGFARFEAGDWLGIVPEGSCVPRLYSLASGSTDGFIEIVVRKHEGGLASGQLTALQPDQTVRGFVRRNPDFHVGHDRAPLILIGAGTGLGPLAGFIRANTQQRPIHLFFGLRNPDSDFLYRKELSAWQAQGRLANLSTAISRADQARYVQDALRQEGPQIAQAIAQGAKIMVCGGRDMARGVAQALAEILQPTGLTPAMLKAGARYVEDIY